MRSTVRPSIDAGSSPRSAHNPGGPSNPRASGLNSDDPPPAPLDSASLRALSEEFGQHFPQLTDETELVLMEISPHQLHAYWHITPWDLQSISQLPDAKNSQLILRFHDFSEADLTLHPPPSFDIEINQPNGSQYIEVWEDARRYGAELGLLTREGVLLDLARSNTIELPRAGQAISPGTQVLTLTPLADDLYQVPSSIEAESVQAPVEKQTLWQADEDQPTDRTLTGPFPGLAKVFPNTSLLPGKDQPMDIDRSPGVEGMAQVERSAVPDVGGDRTPFDDEFPFIPMEFIDTQTDQDHPHGTAAAGGTSRGRSQATHLNPRYAGTVPPHPAALHLDPLSSHSHQPESPAKPLADRREKD